MLKPCTYSSPHSARRCTKLMTSHVVWGPCKLSHGSPKSPQVLLLWLITQLKQELQLGCSTSLLRNLPPAETSGP